MRTVTRFFCVATLFASYSVQAAGLPSDEDIQFRIRGQSDATREALSRANGETAKKGELRISVPKPYVTPQSAKTDDLQEVIRKFNGGKPATVKSGNDLMVFVSLSMPKQTLAELSRQAKEAGAVLILRGLKDGSWKKTMNEVAAVNTGLAEWEIHPGLFKQFKVTAVPAIVLADAAGGGVVDDGCAPDTAYAAVFGDISLEGALNIMKTKARTNIARMAEARINDMRKSR